MKNNFKIDEISYRSGKHCLILVNKFSHSKSKNNENQTVDCYLCIFFWRIMSLKILLPTSFFYFAVMLSWYLKCQLMIFWLLSKIVLNLKFQKYYTKPTGLYIYLFQKIYLLRKKYLVVKTSFFKPILNFTGKKLLRTSNNLVIWFI